MKVFSLLIFTLCFANLFADQLLSNPLERKAEQTITDIIGSGVTKIGDLDLLKLREEIKTIEFNNIDGDIDIVAGGRNSAYYLAGEVFSKPDLERYGQQAMNLLSIHESLGALGYEDSNYQKSILIEAFRGLPHGLQQDFLNDHLTKLVFDQDSLRYEGGATGIGGGGDIATAWLKFQVINYLKISSILTPHELLALSHTRFEPNNKNPNEETAIIVPHKSECGNNNIVLRELRKSRSYSHIIPSVLIPSNYHKMNSDRLWKIVIDLARFFRVYYNNKKVTTDFLPSYSGYQKLAHCHGTNNTFVIHESIKNNITFKNSNTLKDFISEYNFQCLKDTGHEARISTN
jgi:hypothetical protein